MDQLGNPMSFLRAWAGADRQHESSGQVSAVVGGKHCYVILAANPGSVLVAFV
jgi:hypothetical protein